MEFTFHLPGFLRLKTQHSRQAPYPDRPSTISGTISDKPFIFPSVWLSPARFVTAFLPTVIPCFPHPCRQSKCYHRQPPSFRPLPDKTTTGSTNKVTKVFLSFQTMPVQTQAIQNPPRPYPLLLLNLLNTILYQPFMTVTTHLTQFCWHFPLPSSGMTPSGRRLTATGFKQNPPCPGSFSEPKL